MAFHNEEDRSSYFKYYTPTVEVKDYNVILNGTEPFYEIPIRNKEETYKAITELVRDGYFRTGNEFNYEYFCTHYKLISIDLSRQKSDFENQQINFIGKLEQDATIFFTHYWIRIFRKFFVYCLKMEPQKIISLFDHKDDDDPRFETKKWYIINDQNNGQYGQVDENDSTLKFSTDVVKPFLVDYSDAYILVIGDIKVVGCNNNTKVAFKNCHTFTRAIIRLNDEHVETACHLGLIMNLYNLMNYSDNYADSTSSLYHYKRPDQTKNDDGTIVVIADNSISFKYQWELIKKQVTPTDVGQNEDPMLLMLIELGKMFQLQCLKMNK